MSVEITYTLGARGVARVETLDKRLNTAAALRPTTDQTLVIKNEAETLSLFNGKIFKVTDRALSEPNVGVVTTIEAVDWTRFCDARVIFDLSFATGQTLKQVVSSIRTTYLDVYGISIDPSMANGPTLDAQTFDQVTVTEAFNRLQTITGWIWRIGPGKMLEFFAPGSIPAFFELTSSNAKILGGVTWSKTLAQNANLVYVVYGSERTVEKTQTFDSATSQTSFPLSYPAAAIPLNLRGTILVDTVVTDLGIDGDSSGLTYKWKASTNSIVANPGPPQHTDIVVIYDAQFPMVVSAFDVTLWTIEPVEVLLTRPDVYDTAEAQAIADGELRKFMAVPRVITVRTREGFVLPGNLFTITIPERTISGDWTVMTTTIRTEVDHKMTYDYTCAEGLELPETWIRRTRKLVGRAD